MTSARWPRALDEVLADRVLAGGCRAAARRVAPGFSWPLVLDPLVRFCEQPRRAPDLLDADLAGRMAGPLEIVSRPPRGVRANAALARQYLREGGMGLVARKASGRLAKRTATSGGPRGDDHRGPGRRRTAASTSTAGTSYLCRIRARLLRPAAAAHPRRRRPVRHDRPAASRTTTPSRSTSTPTSRRPAVGHQHVIGSGFELPLRRRLVRPRRLATTPSSTCPPSGGPSFVAELLRVSRGPVLVVAPFADPRASPVRVDRQRLLRRPARAQPDPRSTSTPRSGCRRSTSSPRSSTAQGLDHRRARRRLALPLGRVLSAEDPPSPRAAS